MTEIIDYSNPTVKSLPRREQILSLIEKNTVECSLCLQPRSKKRLKVSRLAVAIDVGSWTLGIIKFYLGNLFDQVIGKSSSLNSAIRLRKILETMGPVAIKVGQQMSVRADVLPPEYCRELSKMLDRTPPFPTRQAIEIIEENLGRPLSSVFSALDPTPIGSASLACVYQARLHDDTQVAVKVKRPGIDADVMTDLRALNFLTIAAERLGLLRPGMTRNFRLELTRMLTEEIDFVTEARYTAIFRRESKKNKFVSAPKVFSKLCGEDIIVMEFVAGVFLSEIVAAKESENHEELDKLIARGYDFTKIGKRMMQIFHWECYETYFFHADPHPANIIVKPDNTLVMIDFGSCGSISNVVRRKLMMFNRQMAIEDLHGMTQTCLSIMEPLPPIDTNGFSSVLLNIFRRMMIAHESKHVKWQEKSAGGMWMQVIAATRDYNIPMNLDTLRLFRATFLYDTMIFRLDSKIDPRSEYKKYAKRYNSQSRKRVLVAAQKRLGGPLSEDYTRLEELFNIGERFVAITQKFLDTPRYNFASTVHKAAYGISTLIRTIIRVCEVFLVILMITQSYQYYTTGEVFKTGILNSLENLLLFPPFTFVLVIYMFITVHKILARIDDLDTD